MQAQVKQLGIFIDHKHHRRFSNRAVFIAGAFVIMTTFVIPTFLHSKGNNAGFVVFFTLLFSCLNTFRPFYTIQFVLAALTLKTRFSALNVYLEKLAVVDKFWKSEQVVSAKFRKLYLKLCDGIEIFNETFTLHVAFAIGVFIVRAINDIKTLSPFTISNFLFFSSATFLPATTWSLCFTSNLASHSCTLI